LTDRRGSDSAGGGLAALRHRSFALFFASAAVSNIGTWMQMITVPFVIYEITGSRGWLSAAIAVGYLPQFFVSPIAGAVADRVSRRVVLITALTTQLVAAVVLAMMWTAGVRNVSLILAVVLLSNVSAGFQLICWQAIVPTLVPREVMASAIRLNSVQYMLGRAVGPAAAGFVLGTYGPGAAFVVNAASFLGVLVVLAKLQIVEEHGRRAASSVMSDLRDGVRFVRSHPVAAQAIMNAALVMLFPYAIVQLAPTIAQDLFDVDEIGYSALLVSHGLGSLTATGGLTLMGHRFMRSRATINGLVAAAIGAALVGFTGLLPIGVIGFFLIGFGQSLVSVSQNTALQLQVDGQFRGRVLSLYIMGNIGSVPIGSFVLAVLADVAGIAAAPITAGLLMAAYTGYIAIRSDGMRGLDSEVVVRPA
jgi:MFS family permease